MTDDELMAVYPDGSWRALANTFETIKEALDGATLDLVRMTQSVAMFIDDEGMNNELALNVPASLFASIALYGPVVLVGGPDDEGETLPPQPEAVELLSSLTAMWSHVVIDAGLKGQVIDVRANAETVPEPELIVLTDEQFEQWLKGRPSGST